MTHLLCSSSLSLPASVLHQPCQQRQDSDKEGKECGQVDDEHLKSGCRVEINLIGVTVSGIQGRIKFY